jgi:hypothetical protein
MLLSKWLIGTSCALTFAAMIGPACSDPFASVRSYRNLSDTTATLHSQKVAYRTCTLQGGVRRCRWVNDYGPGSYGYSAPSAVLVVPVPFFGYVDDYYPTDPNDYPIGTRYWWRGMDRFNQGGSPN